MARRKVFQRNSRQNGSFQVTARDLLAVEDAGRYRLLLGEQLLQLHWPRPSQRRHGESRLRGLFHGQWLDRLPFQEGAARPRAVYTLGKQGRLHVAEKLGVPVSALGPRPAKERAHDALFLEHHLLCIQIAINLRLAAEALGGGIAHYLDERALKARRMKNRTELPLIPDAFLVLTVGSHLQSFCIEADRGTVDIRAWKRKARGYWEWTKAESFRKRYASPAVLIVVAGRLPEKRVAALKQALETEAATARADPSLFWLTTLERAASKAILRELIWQVAGQEGLFQLLSGAI